ncbi:MAG: DUF3868 domain-containing protein, partial [Muribaculaceae bacterium]|nr:DUF3868 domain-containing protein [Muribaculaceae bacterium]
MNKKFLAIAAVGVTAVLEAAGGVNTERLHISNLSVNKGDSLLTLNMTVSPGQWRVASNDIVTLTPLLVSETDTMKLAPVRIAGKHAWYTEVRNGRELSRAGKSDPVEYTVTIPFGPEFEESQVVIQADTASICNCNPATGGITPIVTINYKRPRPEVPFIYETPDTVGTKIFNLSGRANIIFKVNRTDIDWTYMGNYAELDTIVSTINVVRDNPDATVRQIRLTGYASPEGPYSNNVRLAKGRTEVVKQYVADRSTFADSIYKTASVPEDWQGLRSWLAASTVPDREAMIEFIDDTTVPIERKNDVFAKKFPEAYKFLLANVYPLLRHTDYLITYQVRRYDDLNEIARVLKTRPGNLSPDEVFKLAMSYPKGSVEYDEVMMTAARLFPGNRIANLNAANSAMNRGEYKLSLIH